MDRAARQAGGGFRSQVNLKTFFGVEGYFLTFKPMKSGFSEDLKGVLEEVYESPLPS
ncbi:hypothetical protein [Methanosarcina mazei]|jgi:hypothetical protein|uniref:hypothetical protein n=1 Tax=Methanosarcina mazei TaxID=2209 RepID=UPI0012D496CB|nr:hypothetical protein [Methanosarcina mazei]